METHETTNNANAKASPGVDEIGVLEAIRKRDLRYLINRLEKGKPRWVVRTLFALIVAVSVFLPLRPALAWLVPEGEQLPPLILLWVFLTILFLLLDFVWKKNWPQCCVWRRRVSLHLGILLAVIWLAVLASLVLLAVGWNLPSIITPPPPTPPPPRPLYILFDDTERFGTWEFSHAPDEGPPAGVLTSNEIQAQNC
jgi:hypothetical protein